MEHFRFVDGRLVVEPFTCPCGKEHIVPIREVIVKPGALQDAAAVLDRLKLGKRGVVIADVNTFAAAGAQVVEILRRAGYAPDICLFQTREPIHPDEYALGKVLFDLNPGTSFLLVVGSGCLTDITRVVSSRTGIPFIAVATAASMDGYASVGAAMLVDGLKKTINAGPPIAIIADVDVLCQAPYPMTAAGFGDLLGKLNSRVDWKLANLVSGEYYCDEIVAMVDATVQACISQAADIRVQTPAAIAKLAEGLILSGIGMLVVGNSRPASGAEHHLSHFWEMKAILDHRPEHFHGKKVGVGTAVMAKFYEQFFARDPFTLDLAAIQRQKPSIAAWEQQMRVVFGAAAEGVIAVKKPALLSWETHQNMIAVIQTQWEQIQQLRKIAPTYDQIVAIQQLAGGAYRPQDVDVDAAYLRETLRYAKDTRAQYTVLSVADLLGWSEDIIAEIACR